MCGRHLLLSLAVLMAWGLGPASEIGRAQVIRSGPPTCKAVALTFDLCPVRGTSGYDEPLIKLLEERRIPATFFMSGRWMATHETEVRALLAVPFFEVGTHGQVHAHLPLLDAEEQRAEIQKPITLLERRYARRAPLFRPPYGEYDDTTVEVVRALGLRFILWNAVSGDPDPALTREAIQTRLSQTVRSGSIIVFHANGKGRHTRAVVEDLTDGLFVRKGLKPVTVTELLDQCPSSPPR